MTFIIAIILAPLVLVTFWFALELVVGLRPLRSLVIESSPSVRGVIVVPAHNEESVLRSTLAPLIAAAGSCRLLLVADNCTDGTAEFARIAGAEVIERVDGERRGKGFALDFARNHLEASPPDVVLIVDADCTIDTKSVGRLIQRCAASGNPCQATNLQRAAPDGSPAVQVSTFAFFIKNVIRQRALQRLAGRVHLLGTGMAFPWVIFAKANLATGNIVEDLKLGQELARAAHPPTFAEDALVLSDAETDRGTLSQRARWEGGFLENAFRAGPAIFVAGLVKGDLRGLSAAINLMVPPAALLMVLDVAALLLALIILGIAHAPLWPAIVLLAALLGAAISLILCWAAGGSRFLSLRGLVAIPIYVAWKIPMYMGFARRGAPKEWVRTHRP